MHDRPLATIAYLGNALLLLVLLAGCTLFLAGCGSAATPEPAPTRQFTEQERLGRQVFTRECAACHSLSGETTIVGPPLAGIAVTAATRVPGQDAQTYILTAIMRPGDYLVAGYPDTMPDNFGRRLTGEEIDAVVAFLLTLDQ